MKNKPIIFFAFGYVTCILFFGFSIRICERSLVRGIEYKDEYDKLFDWHKYSTTFWVVFITLPTVGYGDRFPKTNHGRAITSLLMIAGVFLISILCNALSNDIKLTSLESKSVNLLEKI